MGETETVGVAVNVAVTLAGGENHQVNFGTQPQQPISNASYGSQGSGAEQLSEPRGICLGPDNLLYIADTNNHRIMIFNPATDTFDGSFGSVGTGDSQFQYPFNVRCDVNFIYVSDPNNNKIKLFNISDLTFSSKFGLDGTATDSTSWYPRGLCLTNHLGMSKLYVTSYEIIKITSYPGGTTEVNLSVDSNPWEVIIDAQNNKMYVTNIAGGDSPTNRLTIYNYLFGSWSKTTDVTSITGLTSGTIYPKGLWLDPNGYLWLVDGYLSRVIKLDPLGRYIMHFSTGSSPNALTFDHEGDLYVACGSSVSNSCIKKYSWN